MQPSVVGQGSISAVARTSPAVQGPSRCFPSWRVILREPFLAGTWRTVAYPFLALPVGLFCVPVALLGGPAARVQLALLRKVLGVEVEARERIGVLAPVHAVAAVPLHLVAAVVVFYFWFVVATNLGYPLRPDNDFASSWGGPTLAGAWTVHAAGGGVAFLLAPWVGKGFAALQVRLAKGFLGREGRGAGRAFALAVGVAALCALLSVPIIHQLNF